MFYLDINMLYNIHFLFLRKRLNNESLIGKGMQFADAEYGNFDEKLIQN